MNDLMATSEGYAQLTSPLGLIAGNGVMPFEFVKSAKEKGFEVVTVAHIGETDEKIGEVSENCSWIKVGQVGKLIKALKRSGVKNASFAGGICKPKLFNVLNLDLKGFLTLAKASTGNDDSILRTVAREIEKSGIRIFAATLLIDKSTPPKGVLTSRALSREETENAKIGWQAAEDIGRHDIGQTVVVNRKVVVAVEAIEGTDACMQRAGQLSGKCATVVKLSKPNQDLRFDLPAVGVETIAVMKSIGATALVLKANCAVLLNPQELIEAADQAGIAIEAW